MKTFRITSITSIAFGFLVLAAVEGCGSDSGSGGASCSSVCVKVNAAHCSNDPDCMTQCAAAKGQTPAGCTTEYNALARCFSKATFTCDDSGKSDAAACKSEEEAWQSCIDSGGADHAGGTGSGGKSGSGDQTATGGNGSGGKTGSGGVVGTGGKTGSAGSTTGPGASCNGHTATTACGVCLAKSCCTELTKCQNDADCSSLGSCVDQCADDTCVQSCADATTQDAVDLYNATLTCADDSCASACSDGGQSGSGGTTGSGGAPGSGGTANTGVGAPNDGNTGTASPTTPKDCLEVPSDITGYCGDLKYKIIYDCPNGAPYTDCQLNTMDSSGIYCCGH